MVKSRSLWASCLVMAGLVGCKPAPEGRPSLLDEPRVLAIQSSPAEAAPGDEMSFELLRAGSDGRVDFVASDFAFCLQRKPIAAPGLIAPNCRRAGQNDSLARIGPADPLIGRIPDSACEAFGPKQSAPLPGEPPLRPADPDTTGGYYQPARLIDGENTAVALVRLSCGVTGTTQENSIEFGKRHRTNENPSFQRFLFERQSGKAQDLDETVATEFQAGEEVRFAVTWEGCSRDEARCGDGVCGLDEDAARCEQDCGQSEGCHGAETYLLLDPATNQLRFERETIRVSWYVTGGSLEKDRSGRSPTDLDRDTQNTWVAPEEPGEYWLVAVIRDDRGGVGWALRPLRVTE